MSSKLRGLAKICVLFVCAQACASAPKNEHEISSIYLSTLRVRRPPGPGADPKAGPGGEDYTSHPLPNEQLDCETLDSLFREMKLAAIRKCFADQSGPRAKTVSYSFRLKREAIPYLELRDPEKAPACLRETLGKIPVPREILFQGVQGDPPTCFSSRLDIEANQVLGIRLPTDRLDLQISFPLQQLPGSDEELERQLGAWSLTPLWGEGSDSSERKALKAKIVPEAICRRCLGEKGMLEHPAPDAAIWP
jgi:hypothetical protein